MMESSGVSIRNCLLFVIFATSSAYPVTQPVYPNQYVSAQAVIPGVQYSSRQPQTYPTAGQPQYVSAQPARPVFEVDKGQGLQRYSTQIKQPIQQVLLASNVDRQIQRVAQVGGPLYLQQIQAAQQQGQVQEAFAAAQRKVTSQTLGRQVQPIPIPQQPQPQYIRELPQQQQTQAVPVARGYSRGQALPGPQHRQQPESEPEDYDPNPSYQFGFDVNDDLYTNYQNRKEQREGNKITGSYSVVDSDGFVRTVKYTADPKEGFKAEVTRQPTDIVVKIPKPDPQFAKQPQQHQQYIQQVEPGLHPQQQQPQGQKQNLIYQYQ